MTTLMMAGFPWGARLKGFDLGGLWAEAFDSSVAQALRISKRYGCLDGSWGGFWQCLFGSTYNAAMGLEALYSDRFRHLPVANLLWLIDHQSAPFQWGENFAAPASPGDWTRPANEYETWGLCFSRQSA